MRRVLRALALGVVLLVAATTTARSSVSELIQKLERGEDFRVRVAAALELGKRKQSAARRPLERALADENPAVRAAAAAALRVLGDRRALKALRERLNDPSQAVRSQIESSIAALEPDEPAEGSQAAAARAEVLVQLGEISAPHDQELPKQARAKLLKHFRRDSRKNLGQLPGVQVLPDVSGAATQTGRSLPLVMVTGRLRSAKMTQEGDQVVYSAKVEYIMHRMPGRAIASLVSGSAKAKAESAVARDEKRLAELRQEAVSAAISSAMRRAPDAIRAAM